MSYRKYNSHHSQTKPYRHIVCSNACHTPMVVRHRACSSPFSYFSSHLPCSRVENTARPRSVFHVGWQPLPRLTRVFPPIPPDRMSEFASSRVVCCSQNVVLLHTKSVLLSVRLAPSPTDKRGSHQRPWRSCILPSRWYSRVARPNFARSRRVL